MSFGLQGRQQQQQQRGGGGRSGGGQGRGGNTRSEKDFRAIRRKAGPFSRWPAHPISLRAFNMRPCQSNTSSQAGQGLVSSCCFMMLLA